MDLVTTAAGRRCSFPTTLSPSNVHGNRQPARPHSRPRVERSSQPADPPVARQERQLVYRDKRIVGEFLAKHVFGKIVPAEGGDRPSDPYKAIIDQRLATYPRLSPTRLYREVRESGYDGSYSQVKRYVRGVRPGAEPELERRFETPPGHIRVRWTSPT